MVRKYLLQSNKTFLELTKSSCSQKNLKLWERNWLLGNSEGPLSLKCIMGNDGCSVFLTSIQVQSAVLDSAASNVLFLLFLVGAPANRQPFIFTPTQYFKLVTSVAGHASDWNVNILMKGRGAQMERMKAFKMRDQVSVSHSHCRCLGTLPPPSSSYETWKSKPHNKME